MLDIIADSISKSCRLDLGIVRWPPPRTDRERGWQKFCSWPTRGLKVILLVDQGEIIQIEYIEQGISQSLDIRGSSAQYTR
jgi:hypothetical protein